MKQTKNIEMEKKVIKKEREINRNAKTISLSLSDGYKGTNNLPIISLEKSLKTSSAFKGLRIAVNEDVNIDVTVVEATGQVWVDVSTAYEDKVITEKKVGRGVKDRNGKEVAYRQIKSYAQCGDIEVTLQNNDEHLQWLKNNKKRI